MLIVPSFSVSKLWNLDFNSLGFFNLYDFAFIFSKICLYHYGSKSCLSKLISSKPNSSNISRAETYSLFFIMYYAIEFAFISFMFKSSFFKASFKESAFTALISFIKHNFFKTSSAVISLYFN